MSGTLLPPPVFSLPSRFSFGLLANTQSGGRSPLDGTEQTLRMPGERWVASLGWDGLTPDEWRPLAAFITALGGRAGRFGWSPAALLPRRATGIAGRTNLVPNSEFVGAGVGTPGAGWTLVGVNGASAAVAGAGIDTDGAAYIDIAASGGATGTNRAVQLDITPRAIMEPGWILTAAATLQVIGAPTNLTNVRVGLAEFNGDGSQTEQQFSNGVVTPLLTAAERRSVSGVGDPTVARAALRIDIRGANAAAFSGTVRVKRPQLERAAAATAYIATTSLPVTVAEGPFVAGAGQAGSVLALRGFAAGADACRTGDLLGFVDPGGRPRLHMVTSDATAAEAGTCSVAIAPPLRGAPADGAACLLAAPTAIWRLTADRSPLDIARGLIAGGTLEIEEAVA